MGELRPRFAVLLALALAGAAYGPSPAQAREHVARSIELSGTVDPATAGWIDTAVDDAREDGVDLLLVTIDTPGGLDSSMRDMVKALTGAPMPVVTFVYPNGARAASAGLFVLQAGDVAAMAPETNVGSATPISLGGGDGDDEVLGRKIRNDAAAYVRALAEARGRNADLAERMVRDAANVTATRALRERLIDAVASDQRTLLRRLDGFRVKGPKARTLETTGMQLERRDMPLIYEARQLLVNPTISFLLLMGGLLGILIEIFSPGLVGPGLFGAIALLLGLYGTAQLPVAVTGVLLLLLALGLLVAETQTPTAGALGAAGIAALIAGGLLLYDTDSEQVAVSPPVVVAVGALLGSFTLFAASRALALRRAPPHGGPEDLVGRSATVRSPLEPQGHVYVEGALWRARVVDGAPAPAVGERVVVDAVDGLTLHVRPERKEP